MVQKVTGEQRANSIHSMRSTVPTVGENKCGSLPRIIHKNQYRCIMNLNVKGIILKLVKRNTGESLYNPRAEKVPN